MDCGQGELHVFLSEQGTWIKTALGLEIDIVLGVEKVITIGSGKLGFVNLERGILVCDVLTENRPTTRFIPLPKFLPQNLHDNNTLRGKPPRSLRDVVVCADGSIRCVETEECIRCTTICMVPGLVKRRKVLDELPDDVSGTDVLNDADLMPPTVEVEEEVMEEEECLDYLGWRVITWSRTMSCTCWRKESLVHVDDILVTNPIHTAFLAGLKRRNVPNMKLKDLFFTVPSVSIDDKNMIYLISQVIPGDQEMFVITVDMEKKTVEGISPVIVKEPFMCLTPSYFPAPYSNSWIRIQSIRNAFGITRYFVLNISCCSSPKPVQQ